MALRRKVAYMETIFALFIRSVLEQYAFVWHRSLSEKNIQAGAELGQAQ